MWEQLDAMKTAAAPQASLNPEPAITPEQPEDPVAHLLHQSIARSMEEMTFLPVDRIAVMTASVSILQPVSGIIRLITTPDQAARLAAALHGGNATTLSPSMIRDAMAELINTIAGQLASSLLSADHAFALGLPDVTIAARTDFSEPTRTMFMKQDDQWLLLALSGADLFVLCNALEEQPSAREREP